MLLAEELILLALEDQSGKFVSSATSYGNYAIAGALIMDLFLLGKLDINGKYLVVTDSQGAHDLDDVLQDILYEIQHNKKPKSLKDWIEKIASYGNAIINFLLERLTDQGILRREERTVFRMFHKVIYLVQNPEIKFHLMQKIGDILFNHEDPDARMLKLLSLIKISHLIPALFDKPFRKIATARIKTLIQSENIGKVVQEVITAIESSAAMVTMYAAIM